MRKILGIPTKELERATCFLTWRGARDLGACSGALAWWKKSYGKVPLDVDDHFEEFVGYSVESFLRKVFIRNEALRMFLNRSEVNHLRKRDKEIEDLNKDITDQDVLFFKRMLKAVIIHLCTFRDNLPRAEALWE